MQVRLGQSDSIKTIATLLFCSLKTNSEIYSTTTPACQGFLDIEQEFPLQHNFRLLASVYAWLGAQTLPKHVQPGMHLRMHLLTETEYLC